MSSNRRRRSSGMWRSASRRFGVLAKCRRVFATGDGSLDLRERGARHRMGRRARINAATGERQDHTIMVLTLGVLVLCTVPELVEGREDHGSVQAEEKAQQHTSHGSAIPGRLGMGAV
jgi:hypothetical protein